MFQDAMTRLAEDEVEELLALVNPKMEGSLFDTKMTVALASPLSFYPNCLFVDVTDQRSFPPRHICLVREQDNITFLDWTNRPIYNLNKTIPLKLTEKNVTDYVRLFFNHVRGEKGKYTIVETVDDIPWHDDPPLGARRSLSKMIEPMHVLEKHTDGSWMLSACFLYQSALFKAEISVQKDGGITLNRQTLLAEEMPVNDGVLGI